MYERARHTQRKAKREELVLQVNFNPLGLCTSIRKDFITLLINIQTQNNFGDKAKIVM